MSNNRDKQSISDALSRRGFVKSGGVAIGMLGLGQATTVDAGASMPAAQEWEATADVVIVGYGGAGATAAVFAARAGATVIILEAQAQGGGSSAINEGAFTVGGGTRIQKLNGFNETADDFYKYLKASAIPRVPDELVRAFANSAKDLFDFVESIGVEFKDGYVPGYHMRSPDPEKIGLLMILGERDPEVAAIVPPVPHTHLVYGSAPAYWTKISAAVEAAGVRVLPNSQVTRLIVNDSGRVIGIAVGQEDGTEKCYKANKGVLLSTGGFGANLDMVTQYSPYAVDTFRVTNPMDLGMGIRMAQAVGADMQGLSTIVIELLLTYRKGTEAMVKGIAVNQSGRRYVAETADGSHFARFVYEQIYPQIYVIVDKAIMDTIPAQARSEMAITTAATIEELAGKIHVDAVSLEETVTTYNKHAATGTDPEFHKDPTQIQEIRTPPFHAVSFSGKDVFTLTSGGLRINAKAQVLSTEGKVIPGLYAAGVTAAMICGEYYRGGTCTSTSQAFGRIAGIEMAKELSHA